MKPLIRSAILSLLTVALTICVAILISPPLHHYMVALLHDPGNLQALESDRRIHYEEGAEGCALDVAAILPAAIELVEARQGRPFRSEPIVGVYASYDLYARANGLEEPNIAATSRSGRVILSPTLCGPSHDRAAGVLTHELSHSHLFGWRSSIFSARPPSWFTEGLAVMVSNGGAAEGVSDLDAASAITRGDEIVIEDDGLWTDLASIPFQSNTKLGPQEHGVSRQRLAYREAGMFVAWLQESDPLAFSRFLNDLENGEPFGRSFRSAFGESPAARWKQFVAHLPRTP